MQVNVVHPSELGQSELTRWRELQGMDPALRHPFLAPEFTLAVARAQPAAARVAVLEDGPHIVGFLPYEVRAKVIGRPIGAMISEYHGVIQSAELDYDARDLVRACRLPVWEFDHLIAHQRPFVPFHRGYEGSPVLDLSQGYDAYLAARRAATSNSIKAALRKRRKLARECGELRLAYDVHDPEVMATLMRWKSAQYQRTPGMYDRFAVSWITQVVRDLADCGAPGCAGTLSALYAGDQLIAVDFSLRSESVLVDWFPAYDPEMYRYSPGVLIALAMAQTAADSGISLMDLGKGAGEFKDMLKTREVPVAVGTVEVSRPVALARRLHLTLTGRPPAQRAPAAADQPMARR